MKIDNFETERFIVKKFTLKLINKNYLDWFNDCEVNKFITFNPKNLDDLKNDVLKTLKLKNAYFFAIFHKKKHIGNIKIHNIDYQQNKAWLGILIGDKNFRGIGATPEIVKFIKISLIKKKIYFLRLNVDKKNVPAIKSYLKSGFVIEKTHNNFYTMRANLYSKKIILGLAQLQSIYGVTNYKKKKLSKKKSIEILKYLDQSEISEVDTAFSYPLNIDLFRKTKNKILFNTKLLISDLKIFNSFVEYLKKLKKFKNIEVNTLFVHDGNNLISNDGKKLMKKIQFLKKNKLINKIGVSFHDYKNFKNILETFIIDVIQIPFSSVDRRGKKYFSLIKKKNIEIQARSIFLQGALLQKIKTNIKLSKIYDKIKIKRKIDRLNILISFILNEINIDKIVIGVRQVDELKMILNFSNLRLNNKINMELISYDLDVIDPLRWKELNYHEKK